MTNLGTNKAPIERIFREMGSCFLLRFLQVSYREALCYVSLPFKTVARGWIFRIFFWHPLLLELGFLSIMVLTKVYGWLHFIFVCLFLVVPACKCFIPLPLVFLFLASETCNDFHPMFFTHDRSFEEFFCICIQLLNKTWKEMRATSEDFNKARKGVGRE